MNRLDSPVMQRKVSGSGERHDEFVVADCRSGEDGSFLSRGTAGCLAMLLSGAALLWLGVFGIALSVIDEGIFHQLSRYESEPAQGWEAVRAKVVREALPSWIVGGAIWLAVMAFVLRLVWRCVLRAFGARPGIPL